MRAEAVRRVIAQESLRRVGVPAITAGRYTADPALVADARFLATAGEGRAVQVALQQNVAFFFGRFITGREGSTISARATAVRSDLASFSIGGRAAAFAGGLPNALLSALLGSSVNLSLIDYNALAGAKVDLLAFIRALGLSINANALTYDDILAANVTLPQLLTALASSSGNASAGTALQTLAAQVPGTTVRLDQLIDLGVIGGRGTDMISSVGTVDAFSLMREALMLANGGKQLALNTGLNVPGLLSAKVYIAIGQRAANSPWLAVSRDNDVTVRTAQARIYLDTSVGAGLLGLLSVRLPLYVEIAQAQARLSAINCSASGSTVDLQVQPSIGRVAIADIPISQMGDMSKPVSESPVGVVNTLLGGVTVKAGINLAAGAAQTVRFSEADAGAGTIKTVDSSGLTQGIAASLLREADIRAFGINLSGIVGLVGTVLGAAAPAVDALLEQLLNLLGLHLGQADVTLNGVRCGEASLVM